MNGAVALAYRFIGKGPRVSKPQFTRIAYERAIQSIKDGTFSYYGQTVNFIYSALIAYPIQNAHVAVFGATRINCDAIALAYGAAKVTILEYNPPSTNHPKVDTLEVSAVEDLAADAGFSISSFEHDGLGRFGDPLDPDGDVSAMRKAKRLMRPGGLLFLAVPVGRDCLVWNAHRIYGRTRLPLLLSDWEIVATFGFDKFLLIYLKPIMFNLCLCCEILLLKPWRNNIARLAVT